MISAAVILRTALVSQTGFCLPTAITGSKCPVYVGHLPDTPDIAACLYDTEGFDEGRLMGAGTRVYKPGIQVRVRGKSYEATFAILDAIRVYFEGLRRTTFAIGGVTYQIDAVKTTSYFALSGRITTQDENRMNFTLNCVATITEL